MANISKEELAQLEGIQTEAEWQTVCRAIKTAYGGRYPDDWYPMVMSSGLAGRVMARFSEKPGITASTVGPNGEFQNTKFYEVKS